MRIRAEQAGDFEAVRAVHRAAFETDAEAQLVDRLRKETRVISLVADESESIVGHILFSPVTVSGHDDLHVMGLAPVAVVPERQRQGIGSALVRNGLDACRRASVEAVVLLGHPTYYPRFGFQPASRFGLSCKYDVPDEVFMAIELSPDALSGRKGTIRYHSAFANL